MDKKYNFIKTSDKHTAELLRQNGYTELTEPNSKTFCFINNGHKLMNEQLNCFTYTNVLSI